jgi:hypothetical protein
MSAGIQTADWVELRNKKRMEWLLNNQSAYEWLDMMMEAVEFTDDLIDKDKEISQERVLNNMTALMIRLPNNEFYLANRTYLTPFVVQAYFAYRDSEKLKGSEDERHKRLAFQLRDYSAEFYHAAAFCVGGWKHLEKISTEMREFFALETYEEWNHG